MDFDFKSRFRNSTANDYTSWDRFGRTKASLWRDYGASPVVSPDYVAYTYDYAGNRTKRSPRAASPGSHYQSFEYDGLHRLQKMTTPASFAADGLTQEWTLDQLGNWTTFKHDLDADGDYSDPGDLNQTRTHNDVNEIGTITGWFNPTYDAAGNMTTIPSPHATSGAFSPLYDAWNRMVHVDNNTSAAQTIEYDGLNRRIMRDEGGVVRHFYYNQQWQVVEERVNGSMDKQYVYHPHYVDAIAMRIDSSGNEHYYLQDANFNVTAMVDDTGTVAERYDYTPYGEVTVLEANYTADPDNQSDISNEYLYTGRRLDPETKLQLNRNRFYASHLGRWVNRDPIGYYDGNNLYAYVSANALKILDAFGLYGAVEGEPCCGPAPGFPNAYNSRPTGISHGTGGASPQIVDDLGLSIDQLQILLDILDIIEVGGAAAQQQLWQLIQQLIETEGIKEQVSPNDDLIDIAQQALDNLSGQIEANRGFTLWVDVEYLSCIDGKWVKVKDQVMYGGGVGGLFGGQGGFPLPTLQDIQNAIQEALQQILIDNTIPRPPRPPRPPVPAGPPRPRAAN